MRLYKTPDIDKSRWQNKTEPQKSKQHAEAVTDNKRSVKKVDFSTLEASFKKGLETHHQRKASSAKNAPEYLDSSPFKELYENIKERSVEIIEKYESGEVKFFDLIEYFDHELIEEKNMAAEKAHFAQIEENEGSQVSEPEKRQPTRNPRSG